MKTGLFTLAPRLSAGLILAAGFFWACRDESVDVDRYLAHLQLDSTILLVSSIVENLDVPWELAWGADERLWFTEQNGAVYRLDVESGEYRLMLRVPDVHYQKSRGLLGMAPHSRLDSFPYVFLHYTYTAENSGELERDIRSRLARYTLAGDTLIEPLILLDAIPGKTFHNGSRIVVADDDHIFLSTGDAGDARAAQRPESLNGKILRLRIDGSIPEDNPIPGSPVWSWGHRNPQGLAIGPGGRLYASDHGPATDDELNLIEKGRNYGWPNVNGFCDLDNERVFCADSNVAAPLMAWSPTIAVAGLAYHDHPAIPEWRGALLLANLKGRALRVLSLDIQGEYISRERIYFQKHFGRIRALCVASNGDIYLSTSNRDWHPRAQPFMYEGDGLPRPGDDRIIRLRAISGKDWTAIARRLPQLLPLREDLLADEMPDEDWNMGPSDKEISLGESLYAVQCAMCHRPDGQGIAGLVPPLVATHWVTGPKDRLIALTLSGISEPIEVNGAMYEQEMPGFATLSDEEIAAVLTFIRRQWGNEASAVHPSEVFEERRALRLSGAL
jgi:glucose/arabinose dehydrogenase/mono/diheme cytochrome c family protein